MTKAQMLQLQQDHLKQAKEDLIHAQHVGRSDYEQGAVDAITKIIAESMPVLSKIAS